jgi:hypothetical protein
MHRTYYVYYSGRRPAPRRGVAPWTAATPPISRRTSSPPDRVRLLAHHLLVLQHRPCCRTVPQYDRRGGRRFGKYAAWIAQTAQRSANGRLRGELAMPDDELGTDS